MPSAGISRAPSLTAGFHQVWSSVVVSSLGDGLRLVALPLLAARLTCDPRSIAAVTLAGQLPWLLFGLQAGALADRIDRRRILWTVDVARALVVGLLAVAVAAHAGSIPLLAAVAFVLGCGQTLFGGAFSSVVPVLVEPAARPRANGRLQAGALISNTLLGTPLGAVLFAVTAALPFAVDCVSFALSAALLLPLRGDFRPAPAGGKPATLRRDAVEGVRWLWRHWVLRRLCLVAGIGNFVGAAVIAVLVLFAERSLHLDAMGFALLLSSSAVGGVAGATLAPRVFTRLGPGPLLRLTMAGGALCVALLGAATSAAVAGVAVVGYGAASVAWNVTAVSQRQELVPTALMGRVSMAYQMATGGAAALGAAASGLTAHAFGLRTPFFACGLLLVAACLLSPRPVRAQDECAGPNPAPAAADGSRG
ncbi:MFS transporter [Streptomyces sp. NBC_00859]|uniref:MFS transporter n=1 Tax=Streptomyces sp. NBC_00859 TaxID=2903682 RepID=UPI003866AD87|nr:MFS transporter [Streptomyces sp. NBC_00859]